MIALSPDTRPTFDNLLSSSKGSIFPDCFFSPLHDVMTSVNELSPASPFTPLTYNTSAGSAHVHAKTETTEKQALVGSSVGSSVALPTDSDRRIKRISMEFDVLLSSFASETVKDAHIMARLILLFIFTLDYDDAW
jgi:phosphoinositide-3-kinase regulatory subunit 4